MADPAQVNMHDAKTNLSKLVERVERGEEIVIARNGEPIAKLVPWNKPQFPVAPAGWMRGEIEILPGFDEMDEEIERMFYADDPDDPLNWPAEGETDLDAK